MGRYSAKKRQDAQRAGKKELKRQAVEYTTTSGRGKNRVAKPRKMSNIPPGEGTGKGSPNDKKLKTIPASQRPKDMQAGKVYGDAGQPKAPKLPPKPTAPKAKVSTKVSSPKKTEPKKPAATTPKKPRTWLKDNYKSGGPAKEALKVKPKKKRLTNKQRKQGGFH